MDAMQAHFLILAINNLARAMAVLPSVRPELQMPILDAADSIDKMSDDFVEALRSE